LSDTENAYDLIAKLRADLAKERDGRHTAEAELDIADDKIAELRNRLDALRQQLKAVAASAKIADQQTAVAEANLKIIRAENDRLKAAIEAESPADALVYALTERDNARREASMNHMRAETAERRVTALRTLLGERGDTH